jgi:hypothetical protein
MQILSIEQYEVQHLHIQYVTCAVYPVSTSVSKELYWFLALLASHLLIQTG